ncbi:hypothetical protein SXCC_02250 [Gluconacetobacter sp. SXCC-1]|nr:hypothetical protein SXCC_02250 [Gluconacetobacter sp. SXCC-1]
MDITSDMPALNIKHFVHFVASSTIVRLPRAGCSRPGHFVAEAQAALSNQGI